MELIKGSGAWPWRTAQVLFQRYFDGNGVLEDSPGAVPAVL